MTTYDARGGSPGGSPGRALDGATRGLSVTVIDHHPLVADSVAQALQREGHAVTTLNLARPVASLETILELGLRPLPRLVFLEPNLGLIGDGMRLISPLTGAGATVVLLTESRDRFQWGEGIRQGAKDVLHKSCSLRDVVATAQRVRDGLPLMSREERAFLAVSAFTDQEEARTIRSRLDRLTVPEREILAALMAGSRAQDIARRRSTAETTVRSQIKSILAKLEITSQLAAVGIAHRVAWEPPPL